MSKSRPDAWMPLYIGDYLRDTAHLNVRHHGAYLLLIMHYFVSGPLSDDDEELATITRCSLDEWLSLRQKVARFFQIENRLWRHKRIDAERARAEGVAEGRRAAARTRWGPKLRVIKD